MVASRLGTKPPLPRLHSPNKSSVRAHAYVSQAKHSSSSWRASRCSARAKGIPPVRTNSSVARVRMPRYFTAGGAAAISLAIDSYKARTP